MIIVIVLIAEDPGVAHEKKNSKKNILKIFLTFNTEKNIYLNIFSL